MLMGCYIFMLLILVALSLFVYRDLLAPPFIATCAWAASFLALVFSDLDYDQDSLAFLFIVFGVFAFDFGFALSFWRCPAELRKRRFEPCNERRLLKRSVMNVILLAELVITGYALITLVRASAISVDLAYLYTSLRSSESEYYLPTPSWVSYGRNLVMAFSVCYLVTYFAGAFGADKRARLYAVIQFFIGLTCCLTLLNRNGVLNYACAVVGAFVVGKAASNKMIARGMALLAGAFTVFFVIFAYFKYGYLYINSGFDFGALFRDQFLAYLAIPLACFQQYFDIPGSYLAGANTFRFFIAIGEMLGFDVNAQQLVQGFVSLGDGATGNVYTIFQYYYADFGAVYALVIVTLLGVLSGYLYKKMMTKDLFWMFLFSLLIYPTFMQFFQDQYLSLTSTWVQYVLVGLVFFRTNLVTSRLSGHSLNVSKKSEMRSSRQPCGCATPQAS